MSSNVANHPFISSDGVVETDCIVTSASPAEPCPIGSPRVADVDIRAQVASQSRGGLPRPIPGGRVAACRAAIVITGVGKIAANLPVAAGYVDLAVVIAGAAVCAICVIVDPAVDRDRIGNSRSKSDVGIDLHPGIPQAGSVPEIHVTQK